MDAVDAELVPKPKPKPRLKRLSLERHWPKPRLKRPSPERHWPKQRPRPKRRQNPGSKNPKQLPKKRQQKPQWKPRQKGAWRWTTTMSIHGSTTWSARTGLIWMRLECYAFSLLWSSHTTPFFDKFNWWQARKRAREAGQASRNDKVVWRDCSTEATNNCHGDNGGKWKKSDRLRLWGCWEGLKPHKTQHQKNIITPVDHITPLLVQVLVHVGSNAG